MTIHEYRVGLEFKRGCYCRAQLKAFDQFLKTNPVLETYYTGMVGRRFCFHFQTQDMRQEFIQLSGPAFEQMGLAAGSFEFVT